MKKVFRAIARILNLREQQGKKRHKSHRAKHFPLRFTRFVRIRRVLNRNIFLGQTLTKAIVQLDVLAGKKYATDHVDGKLKSIRPICYVDIFLILRY